MRHVLRTFFQNARKPGGLSGRIMLWAMNWGHASLAKWGRSHVSPEPDARVLDIGCGGGANLAQFLKLCPQGSVCGIDFSAESVATSLRKNAGAVAAGRCAVRQGDVSRLPYADASFDLVTAFETVYFWPDLPACFREVYRVLKPGGTFIACFYIWGKSRRTDWLVKNILAKKGWFSPPFQTEDELRAILQSLYRETDVHTDGSMVYFRCMK